MGYIPTSKIVDVTVQPILWLRADKGVTTDSNNKVSNWTNQINPLTYEATQSVEENRPLYTKDPVSGKSCIYFTNTTWLRQLTTIDIKTMVTVFNYTLNTTFQSYINIIRPQTVADNYYFMGDNGSTYLYDSGVFINNLRVNGVAGTSLGILSKNKVVSGRNTMGYVNSGGFWIGGGSIGSQQNLTGNIYEILCYDSVLSVNQLLSIERFLMGKYSS